MKDVANLAGVSIQTVSTVINAKPGITPETTDRVLGAIAQLRYQPFSIARSLRTRQTRTIALVVSDIANPSFATMASAAEDYAHAAGYNLILYNTHDDPERERSFIRTAAQRWIDGALFVAAEDAMSGFEALGEANIPIVAIDRIPAGYSGPAVTLDNTRAGQIAAQHLVSLGHTQMAHIAGPLRLRLARDRLFGFRQVAELQGLFAGSYGGEQGGWQCEDGYRAMQCLLALLPAPLAVFAANDRMAIGAMRAAVEAGLRVPEDVSLVGLDDIEVAAFQTPPLTTVRQPFAQLATLATELLMALLENRAPAQLQITIEPELVVRRSTADCRTWVRSQAAERR